MSNRTEETYPVSQYEANKMVRILNGEKLKYTCRVNHPDGKITEWQSNTTPRLMYLEQARALWLFSKDYEGHPIMAWQEGSILLCEENPK